MPEIPIALSDAAYAGLQIVVTRWNAANDGQLTVEAWVDLHLRELAVQDQIVRASEQLQQQAQELAAASARAERERLVESMKLAAPVP